MKKIFLASVVIYFFLVAILCDNNKWMPPQGLAGMIDGISGHIGVGGEGLTQNADGRAPNVDPSGYFYTTPVPINTPQAVSPFAEAGIEKKITDGGLSVGFEADGVNLEIAPEIATLITLRDVFATFNNNSVFWLFGGGLLVPVSSKSFSGVTNNFGTGFIPISYAGHDNFFTGGAFKLGIGDDFKIKGQPFFAQASYLISSQMMGGTGNYAGQGTFSGASKHTFNSSAVMAEVGWRFKL